SIINSQKPFMIRVVQRQPPASSSEEPTIRAVPIPNCQPLLVARVSPAVTKELCPLTSPTAVSEGPSATVTKASAMKAIERITPQVQRKDDTNPTIGWVTRPT